MNRTLLIFISHLGAAIVACSTLYAIQAFTQSELSGQPPWQIAQVSALRLIAFAIFDFSAIVLYAIIYEIRKND